MHERNDFAEVAFDGFAGRKVVVPAGRDATLVDRLLHLAQRLGLVVGDGELGFHR